MDESTFTSSIITVRSDFELIKERLGENSKDLVVYCHTSPIHQSYITGVCRSTSCFMGWCILADRLEGLITETEVKFIFIEDSGEFYHILVKNPDGTIDHKMFESDDV